MALTLLDLSAAFDTIDHTILYDCLRSQYGFNGSVLDWVKSYLSDRKQIIKIQGSLSDCLPLPFGVPQGSVLGPLLFTLYTFPLSSVISRFKVTHHFYADDTQIYLCLDTENCNSNLSELSHCLDAVQAWMGNSILKLNPDKTEYILLGNSSVI